MGMVVVFGGSFNPIHVGHTEIIEQISKLINVDKVLIIPTKVPPHKETDYLADASDRLNMCSIIANKFDNVEVSDIELNREGKSYTIDTVNALSEIYKGQKLALTVGGDMLVSFTLWKDYLEILQKCTLITFSRVGIQKDEYEKSIRILTDLGATIISINNPIADVSSTQIRQELLTQKHSVLLDKKVNEYIIKHNLYGV